MDFKEIKIKDLSAELNIPTKTLLQKCNEVGIEAKNFMKVLSVDEYKKLYSYLNMNGDGASGKPQTPARDKAPEQKPKDQKPARPEQKVQP